MGLEVWRGRGSGERVEEEGGRLLELPREQVEACKVGGCGGRLVRAVEPCHKSVHPASRTWEADDFLDLLSDNMISDPRIAH